MNANLMDLLARLPGPEGQRFVHALGHGTMSVELYAPRGHDPQQPHAQDELYFIVSGRGTFLRDTERMPCAVNRITGGAA